MKVAFISGPFTAETSKARGENIKAAEAVALKYWLMGYSVICPHTNSGGLFGSAPERFFLNGYLELIERLDPSRDVFVLIKGWEGSRGARNEFEQAKTRGLAVVFEGRVNLLKKLKKEPEQKPESTPGRVKIFDYIQTAFRLFYMLLRYGFEGTEARVQHDKLIAKNCENGN